MSRIPVFRDQPEVGKSEVVGQVAKTLTRHIESIPAVQEGCTVYS